MSSKLGRGISQGLSGAATGATVGGPPGAAIGAGIGILTGILGGGDEEQEAAREAQRQALAAITGIRVPTLEEQRVALAKYESGGELTPEMEALITQGPSQMAGIATDPAYKQAQMSALSDLAGLGRTGLSATDRAALNEVRNRVATDTQGRDQAILQNMAARGVAGGGGELAARMMASQQASNQASAEGDRLAAMAQSKALEAMMGAGNMGTSLRNQDFSEQSQKAQAADAIANFNARNQQAVVGNNTTARNNAAAANLTNRQDILNRNTNTTNEQEKHNKNLFQTKFNNDIQKGIATSNAYTNNATANNATAAAKNNESGQIWGAIQDAAGAAGAAGVFKKDPTKTPGTSMSDEVQKEKKKQLVNETRGWTTS